MTILLIAIVVVSSVAGEILVTHGMKRSGEIHDFRPGALLRAFGSAMAGGWLPAGVACMAVAFFSLLAALSSADVSFVVPATAATYVLNTLGATIFLKEKVNGVRWMGAALVTLGVALVSI